MLWMPSLLFVASSLTISSVGASSGLDVTDLPLEFSPEGITDFEGCTDGSLVGDPLPFFWPLRGRKHGPLAHGAWVPKTM